MHPDFAIVQQPADKALRQLGFALESDEDFQAVYRRADGWSLSVEGEPHVRPAFDLVVRAPGVPLDTIGYSVRLVMQAFHDARGTATPVPSLANQLAFLAEAQDYVFNRVLPYARRYAQLNAVPE